MKHVVLILALAMPLPLAAQDTPADEGPGLIEWGLSLLFDGFRDEMEPAMQDMAGALAAMKPAIDQLLTLVDDITHYEAPELLENGDIIIRRKPDAPALPTPPEGGVDL